jgi:hypothetical protein
MALTKVTLIQDGVITSDHLHANHGITTDNIDEGTKKFYTDARVAQYLSANNYQTAAAGYITGITHDLDNKTLTFTKSNSTSETVNLMQYIDDTNLARLTSGTVDAATGIATFTRDDLTTFTVDFSSLLDDTNDYVTSAAFNTSDGVLTLTRFGGTDVTVDLDGRYLQGYTETDPIYTASSWYTTTNNAGNWNTAYEWGDHASAGYLTSLPSHNHDDRYYTETESDSRFINASGDTMTGTLTLSSISGDGMVENAYGNYLHLGGWAVGRTDATAVLVNTAYRADYADSLFNMNISRFANDAGYLTSVTNITGYAGTLSREDNRTISPSELTAGYMKFGFTSWNNNNTGPWADFIHLRSYTDNSGGSDNLISFLKSGIGMRIWQQTYGSLSPYSSYVDVMTSGNIGSQVITLTDSGYYRGSPSYGFRFNNNADTINSLIVDNSGNSIAYSSHRAPIFYDSNDTNYYLNPNSTGLSAKFAGNLEVYARSAAWAEGVRIRVPATNTWGGIRWTRDRANYDGNWALGFKGAGDTSDDLVFWANNNGSEGDMARLDKAGNFTVTTSSRSPIFYDSNNTGYYVDPNNSSRQYAIELNYLRRPDHHIGHLEGSYNNIGGNSAYTNPIYTIGSSYNPASTTLGGMYGIGYAHPNLSGWGSGKTSSWGMYVANGGSIDATIGEGSVTAWFKSTVDAGVSFRAPIFYDSNNTGYYVDPYGASIFNGVKLTGANGNNVSGSDFLLWIDKANNNDWAIGVTNRQDYGLYMDMASGFNYGIRIMNAGTEWFKVNADFTYHASDMRSPIFYDSNNTGYYVDPASSARVLKVECGYNHGVSNSIGCSDWFRSSGSTGWYNGTYGGGIYMTDSTWVRTYNNKKFYVSSGSGDAIMTPGGMKASTFYDYNDTGYYLDPASLSALKSIITDSVQLGFSGGAVKGYSSGGNTGLQFQSNASGGYRFDAQNGNDYGYEFYIGDGNYKQLVDRLSYSEVFSSFMSGGGPTGGLPAFAFGNSSIVVTTSDWTTSINTSNNFVWGNMNVSGTFYAATKYFRIDHPLKPETHDLVHSVVESSRADVYYRGKSKLVNGSATINIDEYVGMTEGTFEALTKDVQCFTTNEDSWTNVKGNVVGNLLTIIAQDETCEDNVSWLVFGERNDDVYINRDDTDENGRLILEPEAIGTMDERREAFALKSKRNELTEEQMQDIVNSRLSEMGL